MVSVSPVVRVRGPKVVVVIPTAGQRVTAVMVKVTLSLIVTAKVMTWILPKKGKVLQKGAKVGEKGSTAPALTS